VGQLNKNSIEDIIAEFFPKPLLSAMQVTLFQKQGNQSAGDGAATATRTLIATS